MQPAQGVDTLPLATASVKRHNGWSGWLRNRSRTRPPVTASSAEASWSRAWPSDPMSDP